MNQTVIAACLGIVLAAAGCRSNVYEKPELSKETAALPLPAAQPVATVFHEIASSQQLYEKRITQHFTVTHRANTVITGKKGIRITVKPGALETMDGDSPQQPIDVDLIELTRTEDLFRCNASTMSNGRLLGSGGSYFIAMKSGGEKLRIRKGANLPVEFPMLTDNAMQLFYGERNEASQMNWIPAGTSLKPAKDANAMFTRDRSLERAPLVLDTLRSTFFNKVYKTMNEEAYYYGNKTTIGAIIDSVNRFTKRWQIDTLDMWPKIELPLPKNARIDTNYLVQRFGPKFQYRIRRLAEVVAEKRYRASLDSLQQARVNEWQPQTLATQIQKYYTSTPIVSLGWINCDFFYRSRENEIMEVDPIFVQNENVEYFILFKNFRGLVSGTFKGDYRVIENMPVGEAATLIAFKKKDGVYYHSKKEFEVKKGVRNLPVEFKEISAGELKKIFGNNISI